MKILSNQSNCKYGFTLMETLLAIGVIGILISIFMTLFLPARGMVRSSLAREESERIISVLRSEMTTLRDNEHASGNQSSKTQFISGFDKAFSWVEKSKKPSTTIVIFSYRADTSKARRVDGSYPAVPASRNVPSSEVSMVTMACPMNSKLHRNSIRQAVGSVFFVRFTQLYRDSDKGFRLATQGGKIRESKTPDKYVSGPDDKNGYGAVLYLRTDFFMMTPPDPQRYLRRTWSQMESPLFSTNMSIRR